MPSPSVFQILSATPIGLATLRLVFSKPPKILDATTTNDALSFSNYVLSGSKAITVFDVLPVNGNTSAIDLLLSDSLPLGAWTIAAINIVSANLQESIYTGTTAFTVIQTFIQEPVAPGTSNDSPAAVLRKFFHPALKGPGWSSILNALGTGDATNWTNAQLAYDQLFLSTASGIYLNRRAAENGQSNPENVGLTDDLFRKLAITTKTRALSQEAVLEVLEVFYGIDATKASIISTQAEPFILKDGDELDILLDEKLTVRVPFVRTHFANIALATAEEVASEITRTLVLLGSDAYAIDNNGNVQIYSGSRGLSSSVKIIGGRAQVLLQFPTVLFSTSFTSVTWNVSLSPTITGNLRFTETSGTYFDLSKVQTGDYVYIYGSEFAPCNTIGSFQIQSVNVVYSGSTLVQWFEISNPSGVANSAIVQGNAIDLAFFRPLKTTIYNDPRHVIVGQNEAGRYLDVIIPATTQAVNRFPGIASYLNQSPSITISSLSRDQTGLVTVSTSTAHNLSPGNQIVVSNVFPSGASASIIAGVSSGAFVNNIAAGLTNASLQSTSSLAGTVAAYNHQVVRLPAGQLMVVGGQTQTDATHVTALTHPIVFEATEGAVTAPASTGLKAWYKADAGITLSGSNVSGWADQSGNGNNLSQVTGALQPLFNTAGINDLPAITFSSSYLSQLSSPLTSGSSPRTIIIITKSATVAGGTLLSFGTGASTLFGVVARNFGTTGMLTLLNGTFETTTTDTTTFAARPLEIEVTWDGNISHQINYNMNTTPLTITGGLPVADGNNFLSIGNYFNSGPGAVPYVGDISEILIYDHVLSVSDLAQTRSYIQTRYGINLGTGAGPVAANGGRQDAYIWKNLVTDTYTIANRAFGVCVLTDGTVLATGGTTGDDITGTANNKWDLISYSDTATSISSGTIPAALATHAQCSRSNGNAMIAGGWTTAGVPLATAYIFTGSTHVWSAATSMVVPRMYAQIVEVSSNNALIAGGLTAGGVPTNKCELYNTSGNTWSFVGAMSYARYQFGLTVLPDGRILVVGGTGYNPSQSSTPVALNSCEIFDPNSNLWSPIPSMSVARTSPSVFYIPYLNQVYVTGGGSTIVEILEVKTMRWRKSIAPIASALTGSMAGFASNDTIAVIGGLNGVATATTNYVIVPGSESQEAGGLNRVATVVATPLNNQLTYQTTDYNKYKKYTSSIVGTITPMKAPPAPKGIPGPFMYDVKNGLSVSPNTATCKINQVLNANSQYNTIQLDTSITANPALLFPNQIGYIVINYGFANQVGPIKYLGRFSETSIRIDPGFKFPTTQTIGSTIYWLSSRSPFIPPANKLLGNAYITGTAVGRIAAQNEVEDITAAGTDVKITVNYPNGFGLGHEGFPTADAAPGEPMSDLVTIYGPDDPSAMNGGD